MFLKGYGGMETAHFIRGTMVGGEGAETRAGYSNVTRGAGVVGAQSTAGCSLSLSEALQKASDE